MVGAQNTARTNELLLCPNRHKHCTHLQFKFIVIICFVVLITKIKNMWQVGIISCPTFNKLHKKDAHYLSDPKLHI